MPYDFTYMWNLRNKTERRDKPRDRLLAIEDKLMVTRGEVDVEICEIGEGD